MTIPRISSKRLSKGEWLAWNSTVAVKPSKGAKRKPNRKGIKQINRKRKASEFARTFGSKERVAFVKELGCAAMVIVGDPCPASPYGRTIDNAHTSGGGARRRSDACHIIPLCRSHHRAYDEHRAPFDNEKARSAAKAHSLEVEAAFPTNTQSP